MKNYEVRNRLLKYGILHKTLAEKLGIRKESLSRMLKYELSKAEKDRLIRAIEEIHAEQQAAAEELAKA